MSTDIEDPNGERPNGLRKTSSERCPSDSSVGQALSAGKKVEQRKFTLYEGESMSTPKLSSPTWKVVYTPVERGDRTIWVRVGTAFVNRDGSWNVKLDALPVNGTLHIRDADPKDDAPAENVPLRQVPHVSATPEHVGPAR